MHARLGQTAIVINTLCKLCMKVLKADPSVKDLPVGKKTEIRLDFFTALLWLMQGMLSSLLFDMRLDCPEHFS